MVVFFKLFFESESFATILTAHGTLEHSQEHMYVWGMH